MGSLELKSTEPGWAEEKLECPVALQTVRVKRFYHFFSRGCCSTYSYNSGIFCELEEECKKLAKYDRCPLLKEMIESDE